MYRIYLADLVYDTVPTNYVVPLNIAYVAAHLAEKHSSGVKVSLFKHPKALEQAIREDPPDMLGLSNYSWNSRLNLLFFRMVKRINPAVTTVMGGPNVRTDYEGLKRFLSAHRHLDYYIVNEGEKTFAELYEHLAGGGRGRLPSGCAHIAETELLYEERAHPGKGETLDMASPYLSGLLDGFLSDPGIIPLLETNRGCPFGCAYCAWGTAALSQVRKRPLEMVFEEIEYVANRGAGQVNWIFCDANFGIFDRDLDIAKKVREIMDKKGRPLHVTLWNSKNTGKRNIEIAQILRQEKGYVAIQSTDKEVLANVGRGNIHIDELVKFIRYYQQNGMEVTTDVLIGLPGETAQKHLRTLETAFDMGFGEIHPYNIRLLPGTRYESEAYRRSYEVFTKYRPIFGAYGIYDGKKIMEIEESVRGTKDMTEVELDGFKVVHWLIYFGWNVGMFKPLLRYGQEFGLNPGEVLYSFSCSREPRIAALFDEMKLRSMGEWFDTSEDMLRFFEDQKNFDSLVEGFVKLNSLYIQMAYENAQILDHMAAELSKLLVQRLESGGTPFRPDTWQALADYTRSSVCTNLLEGKTSKRKKYDAGESLAIALGHPELARYDSVEVEFYRTSADADFCKYQLTREGVPDLSLQNFTRFLEMGGRDMLRYRVRFHPQ